jgi:hypothetical protein
VQSILFRRLICIKQRLEAEDEVSDNDIEEEEEDEEPGMRLSAA